MVEKHLEEEESLTVLERFRDWILGREKSSLLHTAVEDYLTLTEIVSPRKRRWLPRKERWLRSKTAARLAATISFFLMILQGEHGPGERVINPPSIEIRDES